MTVESEVTQQGEVELRGPAGVGVRAKGYRLMDIAWVLLGTAIIWGAWELKAHAGDSAAQSAAVVKSINDGSDRMVKALEKVTEEMKESRAEQKKLTRAQQETNCLLDPAVKGLANAREVCKRITGREDR